MKFKTALEMGFAALGIGVGAIGAGEAINLQQQLNAERAARQHLEQRITDTEVGQKGVVNELTNEEVERCMTDNVEIKLIGLAGGPQFPYLDCSTPDGYSPKYSPDTVPNLAPNSGRTPVTPQTN